MGIDAVSPVEAWNVYHTLTQDARVCFSIEPQDWSGHGWSLHGVLKLGGTAGRILTCKPSLNSGSCPSWHSTKDSGGSLIPKPSSWS